MSDWILLAADEPRPLELSVDLMLFTILCFVLLLLILGRFAWRPLMEGLDRRERNIADQIEQARIANERAQAILMQHEQRMQQSADEANAMLTEARKEADRARERIVTEAQAEAQRQRQRAIADINAAKEQALRELAQHSVDSAISLAGNLLQRELDAKAHHELIERSLQRFTSLEKAPRHG